MENKEFYSIFPEFRFEVFEEKIKKPMELYLHASSNVISMNSSNTSIANTMEKFKLGEASFDENDLFSSPVLEEKICFDDTVPPIYDVYNDEYDIFSPSTIEDKIHYDYSMPPIYDDYNDGCDTFTLTITNDNVHAYVESNDTFMNVNKNDLCDSYIVEFVHDATGSYYERGKHGYMHLNNIKFPLFMLRILKLLVF